MNSEFCSITILEYRYYTFKIKLNLTVPILLLLCMKIIATIVTVNAPLILIVRKIIFMGENNVLLCA
jgi:hypothetical protein